MRKHPSAKTSEVSSSNSEVSGAKASHPKSKEAQLQRRTPEPGSPFLPKEQTASEIDNAKVARARALLQDKEYPSKSVLNDIAHHLASHWSEELGQPPMEPRRD